MSLMRKVILTILASTCCLSLAAFATPNVKISNDTPKDMAFTINGKCSNDIGVVYGFEIRSLSKSTMYTICGDKECEITAHDNYCTGEELGGMTIHANGSVTVNGSNRFRVSVSNDLDEIDLFFSDNNDDLLKSKK